MATKLTKTAVDAAVTRASQGVRIELADDAENGLRLRAGERGAKWSVLARTPAGGRIRVPLGSWPGLGISEARAKARDVKRAIEDGRNPNEERQAAKNPNTLRVLLDAYRAKLDRLRTGDKTSRVLVSGLKGFLDRDPATLTRRDVARMIDTMAKSRPILANRTLAYSKAFFAWAVTRGHLGANPAEGVGKPVAEVSRDRAPDLDELLEIWRAAGSLGYPFGPAIRTLILIPARRDEVTAMRVSELDLTNGVWTLPGARSKNGRALRVPLAPLAVLVLSEALAQRTEGPLVFSTTGETPASGWSKAKKKLDAVIATSRGEPIPPWRLHDLRRAFATVACDQLQIDPIVADRCLNHVGASTTSTVQRVYGRSEMFDQRRDALLRWADLLATAIGAETSNDH